ncbi:uncharacterized protein LOC141902380 [Tubulanus polymorphus]|uniref:uncharacterized protein LOC141902380 n=1 Tax=Tubulanus polymorphus TaxID=672921 RepID=UPI003DA5E980
MFSLDDDDDDDLIFLEKEFFSTSKSTSITNANNRSSFELGSTPVSESSRTTQMSDNTAKRTTSSDHSVENDINRKNRQKQEKLSVEISTNRNNNNKTAVSGCDIHWDLDLSDTDFDIILNETDFDSSFNRDSKASVTGATSKALKTSTICNSRGPNGVVKSVDVTEKSDDLDNQILPAAEFTKIDTQTFSETRESSSIFSRNKTKLSSNHNDTNATESRTLSDANLLESMKSHDSRCKSVSLTTPVISYPLQETTPNIRSGRLKRKFPGPAGALPKLSPGQAIADHTVNTDFEKIPREPPLKVLCSQSTQISQFDDSSWGTMKSDIGINLFKLSQQHCISKVIEKAAQRQLVNCKIPFMCVLLDSINLFGAEASAIFKDPTGDIKATLHRQVVKELQMELLPGSALVLGEIGVFSPTLRKHYLNITLNNIVYIYNKRDGQVYCKDTQSIRSLLEQVNTRNEQFWMKISEEKTSSPILVSPAISSRPNSLFSSPLTNPSRQFNIPRNRNQTDKTTSSSMSFNSSSSIKQTKKPFVDRNIAKSASTNQNSSHASNISQNPYCATKNNTSQAFRKSGDFLTIDTDKVRNTNTATRAAVDTTQQSASVTVDPLYSDTAIAELLCGLEDEMMSDF